MRTKKGKAPDVDLSARCLLKIDRKKRPSSCKSDTDPFLFKITKFE